MHSSPRSWSTNFLRDCTRIAIPRTKITPTWRSTFPKCSFLLNQKRPPARCCGSTLEGEMGCRCSRERLCHEKVRSESCDRSAKAATPMDYQKLLAYCTCR